MNWLRTAERLVLTALLALSIGSSSASGEDGSVLAERQFALCASCHGSAAEGNELFLAPAIAGRQSWYLERQLEHFRSGVRGQHFDDIAGMRMRPMSLYLRSDDEVRSIAGYVASLPRANPAPTLIGGDPKRGAVLYNTCAACHGPKAEGNQTIGSPSLLGQSDWYLLRQLHNFKTGVRGDDPRDAQGKIMRGMAQTLDDQGMLDVIAYIGTLDQ